MTCTEIYGTSVALETLIYSILTSSYHLNHSLSSSTDGAGASPPTGLVGNASAQDCDACRESLNSSQPPDRCSLSTPNVRADRPNRTAEDRHLPHAPVVRGERSRSSARSRSAVSARTPEFPTRGGDSHIEQGGEGTWHSTRHREVSGVATERYPP